MYMWKVSLYGIQWDKGNPEDYDPATYAPDDLPENLEVQIDDADTRAEAIELALTAATDEFCFFIEGTEQIVAKKTATLID